MPKTLMTMTSEDVTFTCPAPISVHDRVVLGHGSGGRLSADLLRDVFFPLFSNPVLDRMDDQAIFEAGGNRFAFTTDSFVVKPLFFPGGDIGSLAVHGTINDLAMGGARPLFLSAAFILEEGFEIEQLRRIAASMADAAGAAGVAIVTGDNKVVEKGKGDGLFINTAGIGVVSDGLQLSADRARPGDRVILSGPIGDHGITILLARGELDFEADLRSDTRAVLPFVQALASAAAPGLRWMRDPTRGGVATALNELARDAGIAVLVQEARVPVRDAVRGACELLGLDPLHIANEGQFLAVVAPEYAEAALAACGPEAVIIGEIRETPAATVLGATGYGGTRVIDMLVGDPLPRIC